MIRKAAVVIVLALAVLAGVWATADDGPIDHAVFGSSGATLDCSGNVRARPGELACLIQQAVDYRVRSIERLVEYYRLFRATPGVPR